MELSERLAPTRDCACSSMRRAARAVTSHFERRFRGSGLRATQFTILSTIAQMKQVPLTRLADFLGLERTTLTRNLDVLIREGLVSEAGDADARIRLLRLTDTGAQAVERTFPLWRAAQDSVDAVLAKHAIVRNVRADS